MESGALEWIEFRENNENAKVRICYNSKSNYDKLSSFAFVAWKNPKCECQYMSEKQQVVRQHACEFPKCDSFPPSMLIKRVRESICVCEHVSKSKKKKKVCATMSSSMWMCMCVCGQVYAFFFCMKCAGVWVGAGLCKYWCIAVRKAITNSGPRASLYWAREREEEEGGTHTKKHTRTHTQKTATNTNTITQTRWHTHKQTRR